MKVKTQNFDPQEWAVIEQKIPGFTPEILAEKVHAGKLYPWINVIAEMTDAPQKVLDLGCGVGHLSATLALKGCLPTLMDFSRENLDFCRALFNRMNLQGRFMQGDITQELPFEDGSFDTSICCSVLQLFSDEQIECLLREASRVTRHRVIFTAPNALCLAYRIGKAHMQKTGRWHWSVERHFRSLRQIMHRFGDGHFREFSVGPWHAMNFLTMRGSGVFRKMMALAGVRDRPIPTALRQGYMLVAVLDKNHSSTYQV